MCAFPQKVPLAGWALPAVQDFLPAQAAEALGLLCPGLGAAVETLGSARFLQMQHV